MLHPVLCVDTFDVFIDNFVNLTLPLLVARLIDAIPVITSIKRAADSQRVKAFSIELRPKMEVKSFYVWLSEFVKAVSEMEMGVSRWPVCVWLGCLRGGRASSNVSKMASSEW